MTTPTSEPTEPPISAAPVPVRPASTAAPRVAGADEPEQIARILVAGYIDTPQSKWLIKDQDERLVTFAVYWPAMVRYSRHYGQVDVATGQSGAVIGVAIWFHTADPGDPVSYRQYLADSCREHLGRFLRYDQLLADHQPDLRTDVPGSRLAWLAVPRHHRGRGVGSALLRYRHALLDAEGRPATLIANTGRTRKLFTDHGYQAGRAFRLPGGPTLWPMVRAGRVGTEPGDDAPPVRVRPAASAGPDPGS
jgi:GNAT superfamily N-acetyltransferase